MSAGVWMEPIGYTFKMVQNGMSVGVWCVCVAFWLRFENGMSAGVWMEPIGYGLKLVCLLACGWSRLATGEISIDDKLI